MCFGSGLQLLQDAIIQIPNENVGHRPLLDMWYHYDTTSEFRASRIDTVVRKWFRRLAHPFAPGHRAAGYRYHLSRAAGRSPSQLVHSGRRLEQCPICGSTTPSFVVRVISLCLFFEHLRVISSPRCADYASLRQSARPVERTMTARTPAGRLRRKCLNRLSTDGRASNDIT